jgi:hypothetical protein
MPRSLHKTITYVKPFLHEAKSWATARRDAEKMLADYQRKVVTLKRAIKVFEQFQAEGKPFPK